MKTYTEVVTRSAEVAYRKYVGGAERQLSGVDFELIAFVYGVTEDQVYDDVSEAFVQVMTAACEDAKVV